MEEKKASAVLLLLRVGVAFAFLYPPLDALANPYSWIGYFPQFMTGVVPDMVLLHSFGLIEVVIALWILSGKRIFLPSSAAALLLLGIVAFNPSQFEVIFRDLSIAFAAAALAVANYPSRRSL
jgi:uncharacterized membrane protein YphA (DoxX/SURF4 family)